MSKYIIILISLLFLAGGVRANKTNHFQKAHCAFMDTVYISLINDSLYGNEVIGNDVPPSAYSIWGFVSNNIPKDHIDSIGYKSIIIDLSKQILTTIEDFGKQKQLNRKMLSLYDLRDNLKIGINMNLGHRWMPPYDSFSGGDFAKTSKHVLIAVIQKDKKYLLYEITNIRYFYPYSH